LEFDLFSEAEQLRREPPWQSNGRNSKTLAKYPDSRVVLIAMKPGNRIEEHKTDGRISVQTLAGRIRVHLLERVVELPAGHLLVLDRSLPHDVEALEESTFLLSLFWSGATRYKTGDAKAVRGPGLGRTIENR
jgi:quercetin dioxygenase-like cupin family protein